MPRGLGLLMMAAVVASGSLAALLLPRSGAAGERYALAFSTLLGGSGGENFRDVAVDHKGNIYVTGGTSSRDFPTTPGAYDRTLDRGGADLGAHGPMDVFVAKLSPSGQLLWSTYLGGPNYDRAYAIEVDRQGHAYVAGRAGPGFPVTPGALQAAFAGDTTFHRSSAYGRQDGFVAKLAPDGSRLVWSTYFGESCGGFIRDVDIDTAGNVYVVSAANASHDHPHVTAGAYDATHNGRHDLVVAKIAPDGRRVVWGTYLGGSANDGGGPSVRVDRQSGDVVVVGNTSSADFPTPNGHDTVYNGSHPVCGDAFVARLSADGRRLLFASYLGGSGEEGTGTHNVALGPQGEIVVAHWTKSTDIRILPGGFRTAHAGGATDCIVWKFSRAGRLLANTYLGGNGDENVQGVVIDAAGNVHLSIDASTSTDLPVTAGAHQATHRGRADAAFVKLSPDLRRVLYATYLGGRGHDGSREAALGPDGSYVCAGDTASPDFPLRNAFDNTLSGRCDGFVARFRLLVTP